MKYIIHNVTKERQGFAPEDYNSDLFNTYEEALKELENLIATDKSLNIKDEYYIEQIV